MEILKIAVWLFCGSLKVPALKTVEDEQESDMLFLTKLVGSEGNLSQSDFIGKTPLTCREATGSVRTALGRGMANGTNLHLLSTDNPGTNLTTSTYIKALLPPCFINTMGFRCLLLARRLLKIRVSEADLVDDDDSEFNQVVDPHVNIWNVSSSLPLAKRIKKPTSEHAELFLRQRFMSLFAWPAVVSNALVETTGSDTELNEDEKDPSSYEPLKPTKCKRRSRMFTGKAVKRKKYMKMRWDEAKEKDNGNPFKKKKH